MVTMVMMSPTIKIGVMNLKCLMSGMMKHTAPDYSMDQPQNSTPSLLEDTTPPSCHSKRSKINAKTGAFYIQIKNLAAFITLTIMRINKLNLSLNNTVALFPSPLVSRTLLTSSTTSWMNFHQSDSSNLDLCWSLTMTIELETRIGKCLLDLSFKHFKWFQSEFQLQPFTSE